MTYDPSNIFARILTSKIPCKKVYEDEHALAFEDIHPKTPVHVLVIPKGPYASFDDFAAKASTEEMAGFFRAVQKITAQLGVNESGYRLIANTGANGGQEVPHFHIHILRRRAGWADGCSTMTPRFIIHGGLSGNERSFKEKQPASTEALRRISEQAERYLQSHSALETVVYAVTLLEDDPLFNAGTGSTIQGDGIIRMSASIMDGKSGRFTGVINIEDVKTPVQIARELLIHDDRVLAGKEALAFAREKGFGYHNPETPRQRENFNQKRSDVTGTVGCVALDSQGNLAAATSTGGKGNEIPGRVSDSATVAGNYASRHAAVSCTGVGEDIVGAALAARIVVRVEEGVTLTIACEQSIEEIRRAGGRAGIIALDKDGAAHMAATHPYMFYMPPLT